ncbi:MAG: hypothetical protein WC886_06760 [Saccharofermentanaceae bacterium]|jgi:hypothetical protein
MAALKDRTEFVPFILFAILAGIVAYAMIKGRPHYLTQAEQDAIYGKNV